MVDRSYYQEHRSELLRASREWKARNPERSRELNRESERRRAARAKARAHRRAVGRAWYAAHREQERERAREFRRNNPEAVKEYQRRYREKHPDRVAEQSRRASQKWRDTNAEAAREKQRQDAAARRERDPDGFRAWYQANLERERERGREASRRRSRLKQLGLPPRRIQRVYAADRRANAAAADEFFTRRRDRAELAGIRWEGRQPPDVRREVRDARSRFIARELSTEAAELRAQLRAARALDIARERVELARPLVETKHGGRIAEEVRMDAIARQLRGARAFPVDAEIQRRLYAATVDHVASRERDKEIRGALTRLRQASFPAPHPSPGARPSTARISPAGEAQDRSAGVGR